MSDLNNQNSISFPAGTGFSHFCAKKPLMFRIAAFAIFFFLLFFACSDGKRDIRDYYFPVETLQDGQVYAYVSAEGDTSEHRYWYYRAFDRDSGVFIAGTQYDRHFEIIQMLREKIVDNGSRARNSFLYETDTSTGVAKPIPVQIESPDLFPFKVTDSLGVFLFSLKYHPLFDTSSTIYIIRNRRFLGDGPDFEFAGKKYPTVRFSLHEAIGNEKLGASEVEGFGEEWYAKGLGLVYYQKSFAEGKIRYVFRLQEIFPMTELERRAGQHFKAQ